MFSEERDQFGSTDGAGCCGSPFFAIPSSKNEILNPCIHALLKIGLKSEAACVLEEVDLADGRPEKQLLRALVLHASGQVLEAVKAYDNLPRSFRSALPSGFERILYPIRETRAYVKLFL